ncbi:ribosomal protein S18-alanine N-acetyltransferase [Alteribacter natronophilus]|uniref:ribosomal protein S18-alanine N-acetyltransferase n=1 Tax=Alteribacter natronophilus TaxID=2583810 RepID=UPI00110E4F7B|nr:ribosomal protein S18-alanine N-acetyltransferase [Alteribacter natronophilus]TMW70875.1 ribosomal-protein-alanine N-acetyltransferase [Alteribacter natronophilus]
MGEEISIRLMELDDVDGVMAVEEDCFPVPWSRSAFVNELQANQFAYYLVAEAGERIIGYCGVWVIIDEAHITNIAVHSDFRRKGIGEALLTGGLELARTFGAKKLTLEVRVSNEAAQRMYEKHGFERGGVRKNYYTDNQEDAQIMWVMME